MSRLQGLAAALMLCLLSGPLAAQQLNPSALANEKYGDVVQRNDEFYAQYGTGRGTGYRPHMRWRQMFGPRMYPADAPVNISALAWLNHFRALRSPEFAARKEAANAAGVGTGNWRAVGPLRPMEGAEGGDVGRVNAIAFHPTEPKTIYIGTPAAGIWRTQDEGVNWTPLNDGLPLLGITDIAVDPLQPQTLYILSGDGDGNDFRHGPPSLGVLKSTDGGLHWEVTGLSWRAGDVQYGHRLAIHPARPAIVLAASTDGLFRTEDGGKTWIRTLRVSSKANPIWDVLFHPTNPAIVYAASQTAVYRSNDSGETWMPLTFGLPDNPRSSRIRLGVSPAGPNTLYVLYGASNGFTIGLYRSDDGGRSFSKQSSSNAEFDLRTPNILGYRANDNHSQADYDLALAVSPTNAEHVFVAGVDTWRSEDGGRSWLQASSWNGHPYAHADFHVLAYRDTTLYAGNDGGVYRLAPDGKSWTNITTVKTGLNIAQLYSVCVTPQDPNILFYGAQDNGTYRLWLDGRAQLVRGGDGGLCQIDPRDSNIVYGSYVYGVFYRSDQGGANNTFVDRNPKVPDAPWITPLILDPLNPDIVYSCYADLWRSPDRGFEWINLTRGVLGPSRECRGVAVAPSDANMIYVVKEGAWDRMHRQGYGDQRPAFFGGGGLFRSRDGGTSWENITGTLPFARAAPTSVAVSPSDPRRVWVTFSGYDAEVKVFGSTDGGTTWTNLSAGILPNLPVNTIVAASGPKHGIYVGLDVGVYYRYDELGDWVPFQNGLADVIVTQLVLDEAHQRLLAATFGRGVWMTDAPCSDNCGAPGSRFTMRATGDRPAVTAPVTYTGPIDMFQ